MGDGIEIRDHLYATLRAEARSYIEKAPALWLQKFALIGGLIAFLLTQRKSLGGEDLPDLFLVGIVALPLLSMLLDAKIMEYGLHAYAISTFLAEEYAADPIAGKWERTLWGHEPGQIQDLIRIRSWTTVATTVLPTVLLTLMAGWTGAIARDNFLWFYMSSFVAGGYLGFATLISRRIWPAVGKLSHE
jgi:hypothetical protein